MTQEPTGSQQDTGAMPHSGGPWEQSALGREKKKKQLYGKLVASPETDQT